MRTRLNALIDAIDKKLSEQINHILHHDDFQQLESTWRGLHLLINRTNIDEMVKIKIMPLTKKELCESVNPRYGCGWWDKPLYRKLYRDIYDTPFAEPFSCLVGDYYFDLSLEDIATLRNIGEICAVAHTPFIAGASPAVYGLRHWCELACPRDMAWFFQSPEFAAWKQLREAEATRFIGLTMPRFLGRLAYNADVCKTVGFRIEEANIFNNKIWCNSAYLMAINITRAFAQYGWCALIYGIECGGTIEGLPVQYAGTDDGGRVSENCSLEIVVSERQEVGLARYGLMVPLQLMNANRVTFFNVHSLHKYAEYDDAELAVNASLAVRFSSLLPAFRFAQYLQCMARDNIDSYRDRQHMQQALQSWLQEYVGENPYDGEEIDKPLAAADITILDEDENGIWSEHSLPQQVWHYMRGWTAKCIIRPRYQKSYATSIELNIRLPYVPR